LKKTSVKKRAVNPGFWESGGMKMNARPTGPTPQGLSGLILGSAREIRKGGQYRFFSESVEKYGDFLKFRFAHKTAYLINRPDLIRHVLLENAANYDKGSPGYKQVKVVLGDGLFTSEGRLWKRQRKLLQPAFRHERIVDFADLMTTAAEELARSWDAGRGQPIDVAEDMTRITLSVVGQALLGSELGADARIFWDSFPELLELLNRRILRPLQLPLFVPTRENRRLSALLRRLDAVVGKILRARQTRGAEAPADLLSMLMAARDDEGRTMSFGQLRDEIMTMIVAGHETTAAALSWAFDLLDRHPEALAKIRSELDPVLGGRSPRYADLERLPYLKGVVMETLRLYPPAWLFSRRALGPDVLGGHPIARGSLVLVSPYFLHRNTAVWKNPEEFRPERFLPGMEEQRDRFAFLTFSAGPRSCLGNYFAVTEMMIILGTLLQKFDLKLARRAEMGWNLSLRPKGGLQATIERRRSSCV
jgi:cytochrome P450